VIDWVCREKPPWRGLAAAGGPETWDGYLNDIKRREPPRDAAIDAARPGPVTEGSIGAARRELLPLQGRQPARSSRLVD